MSEKADPSRHRTAEPASEEPRPSVRRDPERTRQQILDAAMAEFSTRGLGGTRVNEVAARAGANKRMLYHYFGNKEALFLAVLESTYETIRQAEAELSLQDLEPEAAVLRLVDFTWDHFLPHPEFVSLLNSENLHRARHLKQSDKIRDMHSPLIDMISDLLARGEAKGVFRAGVDPVQLYITIAALGFFYFSNRYTLSTIFGRDLMAPDSLAARKAHVLDVVLGYLRP